MQSQVAVDVHTHGTIARYSRHRRALENDLRVAGDFENFLLHPTFHLAAILLADVVLHRQRGRQNYQPQMRLCRGLRVPARVASKAAYGDDGVMAEPGQQPAGEGAHRKPAHTGIDQIVWSLYMFRNFKYFSKSGTAAPNKLRPPIPA